MDGWRVGSTEKTFMGCHVCASTLSFVEYFLYCACVSLVSELGHAGLEVGERMKIINQIAIFPIMTLMNPTPLLLLYKMSKRHTKVIIRKTT
jgi:hypothetical protein